MDSRPRSLPRSSTPGPPPEILSILSIHVETRKQNIDGQDSQDQASVSSPYQLFHVFVSFVLFVVRKSAGVMRYWRGGVAFASLRLRVKKSGGMDLRRFALIRGSPLHDFASSPEIFRGIEPSAVDGIGADEWK